MLKWKLVRRALTPAFVAPIYYFIRHRAIISRKAEVDVASSTAWGRGA